jgi:hypothetical protein
MSNPTRLPVIRKALGNAWSELGEIVRRHYDITPGTASDMTIDGVMSEVYHSPVAKLFLLPGRLFGALVPYKGKNIPTRVRNWTENGDDTAMFWHRTLRFPGRSPTVFRSRMVHAGNDEIIEYVRFGVGIRMRLSVRDAALVFESVGYVWNIGVLHLPIPGWAILGNAVIVEKPLPDSQFHIDFVIRHPIFGRTFSYSGIFAITNALTDKRISTNAEHTNTQGIEERD